LLGPHSMALAKRSGAVDAESAATTRAEIDAPLDDAVVAWSSERAH